MEVPSVKMKEQMFRESYNNVVLMQDYVLLIKVNGNAL